MTPPHQYLRLNLASFQPRKSRTSSQLSPSPTVLQYSGRHRARRKKTTASPLLARLESFWTRFLLRLAFFVRGVSLGTSANTVRRETRSRNLVMTTQKFRKGGR